MNIRTIILTAVVTGVVAIVTGMTLYNLQLREPELVYKITEAVPFQGDKESFAIHHVEIDNKGKKKVNNVMLRLEVDNAIIKERKVSSSMAVPFTEEPSENIHDIKIPTLNPTEKVTSSLLVVSKDGAFNPIKVVLRGDGVTGRSSEIKNDRQLKTILITGLSSAYAGLFVLLLISNRYRKIARKIIRKGPFPFLTGTDVYSNQSENLASLLSIHGLPNLAAEFLNNRKHSYYWSESEYLASRAITDEDSELANKLLTIFKDLIDRNPMSASTKSIVNYSMARLYKFIDDEQASIQHLNIAKKIDKYEVESRLNIDPLLKDLNLE